MAESGTGAPKGRLKLREPLASDLEDFCAASYGALATEVVHEALREHIDRRLQEPEMKKRFETARGKRLGRPQKPMVANLDERRAANDKGIIKPVG